MARQHSDIEAQTIQHRDEIAGLQAHHNTELQLLQDALTGADSQLQDVSAHCASLAAEVAIANDRMQQLALGQAGKTTAAPGSLLQQMRSKGEKAEALRAAQGMKEALAKANSKLRSHFDKRQDGVEKHESGVIGPRLLEKGKALLKQNHGFDVTSMICSNY